MAIKLKRDEHGHVVVEDGKVVVVHEDGKEIPFDIDGTLGAISRLNGEAKTHREAKEAAQTALEKFKDLDPDKARQALQTVANLDAKKLVDAGEVEKIRQETASAYEEKIRGVEDKYKPVVEERDGLRNALHSEKIGNAFSRSKFIADKIAVPVDMVQAAFGNRFKIDADQIVAIGADGNKIFSRANPGNIATFDEALEIMVDAYPNKNAILKGSGANGGGGNGGGGANGDKTKTRAAFEALGPAERAQYVKDGGKVVDA
ncbi:MAG TPA: DUF6651 domain-containing protein [Beijerinckiaceae bacterium]|jgi:hypothetical protein|nr:DUF6651 domain-containing protein [Beijerinckiaceae bacterium]